MPKVITIGSTKGGVGKSTIAINLAVEAAKAGKKVMLIDADVQASAMCFRSLRVSDDITAIQILEPTINKEVKNFSNFDLIVIDAGGRDSKVFRSAIMAADFLIVPATPSQFDIWATQDTMDALEEIRTVKENLPARMILNQAIPNTVIGVDAKKALKEFTEICPLLETTLYNRVAYKYSVQKGQGVSEYEPNGKAVEEFIDFYNEVKTIIGG